jgi:hypothetical protein
LLIVDGHDSHNFIELIDVAIENQIHILELPAHTSNWLQPCDRTVFGPLKQAYRKEGNDLQDKFGVMVSRTSFCGILRSAWSNALTPKNIQSGFRSCGIHPFNPSAVPAEAYLPNALYTVETLMNNESLLANVTASDAPGRTPLTSSAVDQSETVSGESTGELLNELHPTETEVRALHSKGEEKRAEVNSTVTSDITDISDFLSREPSVLEALCAAAPANLRGQDCLQLSYFISIEKQSV